MKFKIGKKYCIHFLDHCKGNGALLCEITAYVISEDKTTLYCSWWKVLCDDPETEEINREMVSIVKSTIVKKKLA